LTLLLKKTREFSLCVRWHLAFQSAGDWHGMAEKIDNLFAATFALRTF
jgi:hypothetical protein